MSTMNINYNIEKFADLPNNDKLISSLISTSANHLNKRPEEIIIQFQPFTLNNTINSPDILIRGETSISRRHLIKDWAIKLLDAVKQSLDTNNSRVAVKTFVIDSEWVENNKF
jgi:hypothetical protein